MARLHTRRKGKSGSRMIKGEPKWLEITPEEVEKLVVDLRKAGNTAAQIGVILRDQYGIPSVQNICKKKVTQIIEEKTGKIDYPDDLLALIKRATNMRKHLAQHKSDVSNRVRLQNVESKIRRLTHYYVRKKVLPAGWAYDPETAALLAK
jgi:small subunit ribosomal protein S15